MKAFVMILSLLFLPQAAFSQTPPAPPAPPAPVATPQGPGKMEVVTPEELAKTEAPAAPKQEEKKEETTPGAIVYVRPFPQSANVLPEADYGAFQTKAFSWNSAEFGGKGVKTSNNQFCIEVQSYLVARGAGLYQFAIDIAYNGKGYPAKQVLSVIKLEGNALVSEMKAVPPGGVLDIRSVGAAKLTPGIYGLQVVSGIELNAIKGESFTYTLLMKGPGDLSFRAPKPDELVLKK